MAKLINSTGLNAVFPNRRKLRGSNIFANEDLCQDSAAARRKQMDDFHAARRQGKHAFFNNRNQLIIKDAKKRDEKTNLS